MCLIRLHIGGGRGARAQGKMWGRRALSSIFPNARHLASSKTHEKEALLLAYFFQACI
jgi:hypothetical protein